MIREEQSIKMPSMTVKEKNDYVMRGANQMQKKIEEMRREAARKK